jgi:hypothetical protein
MITVTTQECSVFYPLLIATSLNAYSCTAYLSTTLALSISISILEAAYRGVRCNHSTLLCWGHPTAQGWVRAWLACCARLLAAGSDERRPQTTPTPRERATAAGHQHAHHRAQGRGAAPPGPFALPSSQPLYVRGCVGAWAGGSKEPCLRADVRLPLPAPVRRDAMRRSTLLPWQTHSMAAAWAEVAPRR